MNWNEEMPGFGQDYPVNEPAPKFFDEGWRSIEEFDVPEDVRTLLSPGLVVHSYLQKQLKLEGEQYHFVVSSEDDPHKTFDVVITKKPGQAPVPEQSSS